MADQQNPDLLQAAADVLKLNDQGSYTQPALHLYPHQWLWDSCFISIGLRHLDLNRAKQELTNLIRGQWHNGMMPNMIFSDEPKYKRDREQWRSWINPSSPDHVSTSGITQPPMIAEAVVQIGKKMDWPERRLWYKLMYPALVDFHSWLYKDRDPHNEGLILLIHPWETGFDNNPVWMSELHDHLMPLWIRSLEKLRLEKFINSFRVDTKSIPIEQRTNVSESVAMYDVQLRLRRKAYNINKILDHSLFSIEDLGYNSMLIKANTHLVNIAKAIKQDLPEDLVISMQKTRKAMGELWDPHSGQYYSRDFVTHRLLQIPTLATLLPLYAGCISKDKAARLVEMLENEHLFGTNYPVPSVPPSTFGFDQVRYWQGPSWINTNWMIIQGLMDYGYKDHALALKDSTLAMVQKSGFYEYFNPLTGEGLGAFDFSWTAALTIDLMKSKDLKG